MTASMAMQRVVARALDDETPKTLHEAARQEQSALWDDLDMAVKAAIDRRWSMQCEWIVERITVLAVLTRHITPLDSIAATMPPALYHDVSEAIRARF